MKDCGSELAREEVGSPSYLQRPKLRLREQAHSHRGHVCCATAGRQTTGDFLQVSQHGARCALNVRTSVDGLDWCHCLRFCRSALAREWIFPALEMWRINWPVRGQARSYNVGCRVVINRQSAISNQQSAVSSQRSAISGRQSAVSGRCDKFQRRRADLGQS